MIGYLIKATNTYRVPTVEAALKLREQLSHNDYGELTAFKYVTKTIKEKGEIVEEYQLVTATIAFNNEKEPESTVQVYYGDDE